MRRVTRNASGAVGRTDTNRGIATTCCLGSVSPAPLLHKDDQRWTLECANTAWTYLRRYHL